MSTVIAVMNQKGGVGKTTTSVNLGGALSKLSYRTLLVDLDPAGNLSDWVNESENGNLSNIGSVLSGHVSIKDAIKNSKLLNLDYIVSGDESDGYENNSILDDNLNNISQNYDYIIIDCPPTIDSTFNLALRASDKILIPIQTEALPLRGAVKFIDRMAKVSSDINKNVDILGILPCMFDSRTRLSQLILDKMKQSEHLGPLVFDTVIRKNVRLAEMPENRKSIFKSASGSYGAVDYLKLAEEVIQRIGNLKENEQVFDSAQAEPGIIAAQSPDSNFNVGEITHNNEN